MTTVMLAFGLIVLLVSAMTRILVVEDEGIVALDICEELSALGYEVVAQTPSGESAVQKAEEHRPDLIFMDINLEGKIDGIEAAAIIRSKFKIPVVFLTAHAEEQTLQRAKLTEPYGYIIKPFERDELRVAVELALSRSGAEPGHEEEEEEEEFLPPVDVSELGEVEAREEMLSRHPLFHNLSRDAIRTLVHGTALKDVSAGDSVILEGDSIVGGFLVASGRLAVVKSTEGGKELTLELLCPGDVTGVLLAFDSERPDYSVRAQVDSRILWISLSSLKLVLQSQPELYENLIRAIAERAHRLGDLALSLAHSKVEHRIIATLVALAPRLGKRGASQEHIRIFLTRKELADLTGTTPETAIRVTKALERDGLLDLTRPGIIKILAPDGLRQALV